MTTIEKINRASKQETLHPLICVVESAQKAEQTLGIETIDYYSLTVSNNVDCNYLQLHSPGDKQSEIVETGVYFHPDLLCGTPLEKHITEYPNKCICHGGLSDNELSLVNDCFNKIKNELMHPIDSHSATILSSHIELLLNYCIKICN